MGATLPLLGLVTLQQPIVGACPRWHTPRPEVRFCNVL